MRGGASNGRLFLAEDLPCGTTARDAFLMRAHG